MRPIEKNSPIRNFVTIYLLKLIIYHSLCFRYILIHYDLILKKSSWKKRWLLVKPHRILSCWIEENLDSWKHAQLQAIFYIYKRLYILHNYVDSDLFALLFKVKSIGWSRKVFHRIQFTKLSQDRYFDFR